MNKKSPTVGIGVIILKGKRVLIGKRKKVKLGKNTWGFPGGHLEHKESFEDAARREVFEETGIKIRNIKFASATNDLYRKEDKHYITIYMTCDYLSGKVENKEKEKCAGWKWILWEDLPTPLFFPIQNLLKQNFNPF
ncbi:MAG: NUDIX hydrolase [Patescibacteria group bacterium]